MKTLPSAIIAGKAGNSERVILVRIIPESGDNWGDLLWATKSLTVTGWEDGGTMKTFKSGVFVEGSLGAIHQSADIELGGNVATVTGITLCVANPQYSGENRFDQIFLHNLENRTVEIRLAFWTGSNPAWSDTLLLHRFVVEDVEYDYGEYRIKCRDAGLKRHRDTPDLTLTTADYTVIPNYNKGKPVPLLYGSLVGGDARVATLNEVPAIRIDKGKEHFVMARNKVDDFTPTVYLYFSDINRYAELSGGTFSIYRGRPSKVYFPLGVDIFGKYVSQLETQGSQTDPTGLDIKYAIDDSWNTVSGVSAPNKLYLKAPMPPEFGRIQDEDNDCVLYIQFGTIPAGSAGYIRYYNPEYSGGQFSTGIAIDQGDSGDLVPYYFCADNSAHVGGSTSDWTWGEISVLEFGVTMTSGSCEIKNIWIEIQDLLLKMTDRIARLPVWRRNPAKSKWTLGRPAGGAAFNELRDTDNVAVNVKGAEFGSWVDADSRNNGYNEGDLIEAPGYIIESILRDELGLTSAAISYTALDVLGNTTDGKRKDWKLCNRVDTVDDSQEIITEICKQAGMLYLQNYEGKEAAVALKKETATKTVDRSTILADSIRVSLSGLDRIYNQFYFNYDKSWPSGNFLKTRYLTGTSTNMSSNSRSGTPNTYTGLCDDSWDKYAKMTRRLNLDCDWIRDDATIDLLMKWCAEWLCYRKYIVQFSTALDHINLELGDQIKIDHTLLPSGVSNDDCFLVFDIKHDLDNDRLTFKAMQVPDLLP